MLLFVNYNRNVSEASVRIKIWLTITPFSASSFWNVTIQRKGEEKWQCSKEKKYGYMKKA